MSEENKALVQRWFEEVWNKGRAEAVVEMFASDGIAHGLSDDAGSPLRGPEAFKEFHARFRGAFPDSPLLCTRKAFWRQSGICGHQCAGRIYRHINYPGQRRQDR